MKSIGANLAAHIAQSATTLATCWKVTRTDGQVFAFTDHNLDLVVSGVTYQSESGYTRTAVQSRSDMSVDNLDLDGALVSYQITDDDIRAGRWDFATIQIFMVNWADLTQGTLKLRKGTIGQVRTGRNHFTCELRGMTQELQQEVGRVYGPSCDADLGDTRCTINLAYFTYTGTVDTVVSRREFTDAARSEAAGYFNYGKLTWLTGSNTGFVGDVKVFLAGAVEFQLPMPYVIQVGDSYSLIAGCDKKFTTCVTKFSNGDNFRGYPYIPGLDQLASGGL